MGIVTAVEYIIFESLFNYHNLRYSQLSDRSPERAKVHLDKAVRWGREFVGLSGYVSPDQKADLKYLEDKAAA